MSATTQIFEPAEMFQTEPDWIDFDSIPIGVVFHTRRGLPYVKHAPGLVQQQFDEDDLDDQTADDASARDDWPYWSVNA